MSNIINYIIQDMHINVNAFNFSKYMNPSDDYRISYSDFLKYIDNYLESIDDNIIKPLTDELELNKIKTYLYFCIVLNTNILKKDVEQLILNYDFIDYNLIVLNTLLYK